MISSKEQAARARALAATMANIEKDFGKGSIMVLGNSKHMDVDVMPTGIMQLDYALGVGGLPRGRIIEIYGPESSGKTLISLVAIAEVQKAGGTCAIVDAEHAFDPSFAALNGVDVSKVLISQPDSGEQALEITEQLINSNAIDLILVDSVAALVPRAELEGNMGDAQMGLQARLMSQALRKMTGAVSKSKTTVIFINQIRMKIGVMFGNPETTTGGNALKFYASIRMDVRRAGNKEGPTINAQGQGEKGTIMTSRIKIIKNKVASPFKECKFDVVPGEGLSRLGGFVDMAVEHEVIELAGSWYSYKTDKLGQGKESAKSFLRENPKVKDTIEKELRAKLFNKPKDIEGSK